MLPLAALRASILNAWSTNNRVTVFLVEQLPPELGSAALPGCPDAPFRWWRAISTTRAACGSRHWAGPTASGELSVSWVP